MLISTFRIARAWQRQYNAGMGERALLELAIGGTVFLMLYRHRETIAGALRNGPWNGGGPGSIGPAPAADPFAAPWKDGCEPKAPAGRFQRAKLSSLCRAVRRMEGPAKLKG